MFAFDVCVLKLKGVLDVVKIGGMCGGTQEIINEENKGKLMTMDAFVEDTGVVGILCKSMREKEGGESVIPEERTLDEAIEGI